MIAYKGFNKDMTCRDFQYEEGKTYECEEAILCRQGFHACEYPLDCFTYYEPIYAVYHQVELDGVVENPCSLEGNDTKHVGTKITIGSRLSFKDMVNAVRKYLKVKGNKDISIDRKHVVTDSKGEEMYSYHVSSVYASTCDNAYMEINGEMSSGICSGSRSYILSGTSGAAICCTGYESVTEMYGSIWSAAVCADGESISYGHRTSNSVCVCTDERSISIIDGSSSAAITTGNNSIAIADSDKCVAIAIGGNSIAKGAKGSYLLLADASYNRITEDDFFKLQLFFVDGAEVKADTYYQLIAGKLVEVKGM